MLELLSGGFFLLQAGCMRIQKQTNKLASSHLRPSTMHLIVVSVLH